MTLTDNGPRLLGRKEAAAYCGISPASFSLWVSTGRMPAALPGTKKWDKRAIDARLDEISGIGGAKTASPATLDPYKEWQDSQRERDIHRPLHRLDVKSERILRFMIDHSDHRVANVIPGAGEKTLEMLAKKGLLKRSSKDSGGRREYDVTSEGRAEIERTDTWKNWNQ